MNFDNPDSGWTMEQNQKKNAFLFGSLIAYRIFLEKSREEEKCSFEENASFKTLLSQVIVCQEDVPQEFRQQKMDIE